MKTVIFLACFSAASCNATEQLPAPTYESLGLVAIGEIPKDVAVFVESTCGTSTNPDFSDCAALDRKGRRYVFFDGALARVSARRVDTSKDLKLPAGMQFGEKIEVSARKARKRFGVQLQAGALDGIVFYSSDFQILSRAHIPYSLELIGNRKGELVEVVERTDF